MSGFPAGYKQTEVGVIPEDWPVKTLGKIASLQRGFDLPHRLRKVGTVPIVTSSNTEATHSEAKVKAPGVVTGRYGTIGEVFFVREDFWPLNTTLYVRDFHGNDPLFVSYLLRTIDFHTHSGKSGVPGVNRNDLHEILIASPPAYAEQEAIAGALSDADALIESLEQLLAKKRHLKQAAMQELLTGKKRLPGFSGEWEVKRLGECLSAKPSYGINAPAVPYSDRLPVYLRITDISDDGRFSAQSRVSVDAPNAVQYYLSEGDLVFARTGASVGKSYLYNPNDGPLVFAGFLIRVRPDTSSLVSAYLSEFVKTDQYWIWVLMTSMRSGQPGINGKELGQLQISLPSLQEQAAIAKTLSDMDAELADLETQLDKTRTLKQGMMQKLLTGEIRLI